MNGKSSIMVLMVATIVGVVLAGPLNDRPKENSDVIPSREVVVEKRDTEDLFPSAFLFEDEFAVGPADENGYCIDTEDDAKLQGTTETTSIKPTTEGDDNNNGKPGSADEAPLYNQGGSGDIFFDRLFAIPINILQSVNMYLNYKQLYRIQQGSAKHNGIAEEAEHRKPYTPTMVQAIKNYDHIFNISITALRAVKNLLNG